MRLKLFRSTGYSSILVAGETRVALHPLWMIMAISAWTGFACNVALWRQLGGSGQATGLGHAMALALSVMGGSITVISFCGWRKTLKPIATLAIFVAALAASSIWSDGLPLNAALLDRGMASVLLPSWAGLLRWQFFALLAVLALVPMVWMWQTPLRRLPAQQQRNVNMTGLLIGGAVMAAGGWLLLHAAASFA